MKKHGIRTQRGLVPEAFSSNGNGQTRSLNQSSNGHDHSGRFKRIFSSSSFQPNTLDTDLEFVGGLAGPMDAGIIPDPTIDVPVGMIYLGQFIDHDITLDTTSELDSINDPLAIINFRTPALDLDCIYGDGPDVSPYLFDRNGHKLLTAREGTAFTSQPVNLKAHDLCRTSEGTAIIGDPRNDENRVISQLQLAFLRFHNAVMDKVLSNDPYINSLRDPSLGDDNDFKFAQRLVRWHYQWIVNNEFLPLICGQDMIDLILGDNPGDPDKGRKVYDPDDEVERAFIPIEFAVAAYRWGHSSVPQTVRVNTTPIEEEPLFGLKLGRGFEPLGTSAAIMNWEYLFNINGSNYQRADRLDTKLASILLDLPFAPAPKSLAIRNLKRGFSFQLASGETIAADINNRLTNANKFFPVTPAEIDNLSDGVFGTGSYIGNTPLWFYILAEAATNGGNGAGNSLGPVGGRIVAETLIGIQQKDATSYLFWEENTGATWTPLLIQGNNNFTMADLLTY